MPKEVAGRSTRGFLGRAVAVVPLAALLAVVPATLSAASNWVIAGLSAAHPAQAHSTTLPPATTSLTAACLNSTTETAVLSWAAVAHATSYQVVQATSSGGTYTASPTQPVGSATTVNIVYTTSTTLYYKLYALIGTNWKSALSGNATVVSTTPGFLVFATSGTRCTNN